MLSSSGFGSDMPANKFAVASLAFCRSRTWLLPLRHKYEKRPPMGTSFRTHGGSRTHDPLLRRQLLYPTELREQVGLQYRKIHQICTLTFFLCYIK